MDGPRDDHTKWSKSEIEGQIPYDITYVWNLKKWYTVILFTVSFIVHNFFSLMWFHWFVFVSLVFGVSLTKTLLRLMLLRLPPVFSSWNYMCFTLRLTSLIYFELIVVHGVKCLSWNTVLSSRGRLLEMKLLENSDKKKKSYSGGGMANHFSILARRTPWTVWKGKKIWHLKMSSPRSESVQ